MDEKEFAVINVIPFIDIMLVLLTIVLTTSAFIVQGAIPLQLPRAAHSQAEMLRTQTIEINRQGRFFLNGEAVTMQELAEKIKSADRDTPVLVRADQTIALQIFVDIMDTVKDMGFKKISLQTEQKKS
jgi:biopolymer transport protein ExbD